MPRITIDVEARGQQARDYLRSLSNDASALERQNRTFADIERRIASSAAGQTLLGRRGGPGQEGLPYITSQTTSLRQYGDTIRQVTQYQKTLGDVTHQFESTNIAGSFRRYTQAVDAYGEALERVVGIQRRYRDTAHSLSENFAPYIQAQQDRLEAANARIEAARYRQAVARTNIRQSGDPVAAREAELDALFPKDASGRRRYAPGTVNTTPARDAEIIAAKQREATALAELDVRYDQLIEAEIRAGIEATASHDKARAAIIAEQAELRKLQALRRRAGPVTTSTDRFIEAVGRVGGELHPGRAIPLRTIRAGFSGTDAEFEAALNRHYDNLGRMASGIRASDRRTGETLEEYRERVAKTSFTPKADTFEEAVRRANQGDVERHLYRIPKEGLPEATVSNAAEIARIDNEILETKKRISAARKDEATASTAMANSARRQVELDNERIKNADVIRRATKAEIDALPGAVSGRPTGSIGGRFVSATDAELLQKNQDIARARTEQANVIRRSNHELDNATRAERNARTEAVDAVRQEGVLRRQLGRELVEANKSAQAKIAAVGLSSYEDAIYRARTEAPALPQNIRQIAIQSPQLLRRLTDAGLPTTAEGIYASGAAENIRVQQDLVRNVTRVTGSFRDQSGAVKSINAEYDQHGNVVSRLGGRLRGLGGTLTNLGRDFQKVAEFALATTVIYGAYRQIGDTVRTINELDKQVRQFGITSGFTIGESRELFDQLADVGIRTATPLTEIVGAADNIALAVREAGDSTEEYQQKIVSLTESVGILTNLSGIDTVKATDLLTSAFKQLGLTVDEIPGLLSKVTAVAGGQAQGISDVVEAVAQIGEAARVGGLSVDELVGTVQVLSQVTAKSPKEVATSIKNLIGSLASPGSKKALDEYNVALKDSEGNVRSILDVYGELSEKFRQGIIPEGEQQAIIRAISGGPRRAPDAAALLGAYNQIALAVRRSSDASNEALIANQKVLEGTEAKITQLQAAFDKLAFDKFAEPLGQAAGNLADVLLDILEFIEGIDTSLLGLLPTFALFLVAAKGASVISNSLFTSAIRLGEAFGVMNRGAVGAAQSIRALALAEAEAAAVSAQYAAGGGFGPLVPTGGPVPGLRAPAPTRSLYNRVGGVRGIAPVAIGAGLGAAASAATGSGTRDTVSNVAFGISAASLLIPDPGISKVVAGVSFLAGILAHQFIPAEKETEETVYATNEELLRSITTYRQASEAVSAITADNDALGESIERLSEKQARSAEEEASLASQREQYAKNVITAQQANADLASSYETLLKNVERLPGIPDELRTQIKLARNGILAPDTVERIEAEITKAFLQAADPERYKDLGAFHFSIPIDLVPNINLSVRDARDFLEQGAGNDFAKFVGDLFSFGNIDPNLGSAQGFNLAGIFKGISSAIQQAVDPAEKFDRILQQIEVNRAALQSQAALGLISNDDLQRGLKLQKLLEDAVIARKALQIDPRTGPTDEFGFANLSPARGYSAVQADADINSIASIITRSQDANKLGERFQLTKDQALQVGEAVARINNNVTDLENKGAILDYIKQLFQSLGYDIDLATGNVKDFDEALEALRTKNVEDIRAGYNNVLTDLIGQRNQLEANIAGEKLTPTFDKDDAVRKADRIAAYQEELEQVNALIKVNGQLRNTLLDINEVNPEGIEAFHNALKDVHGLEAIALVETDNLAAALVNLAQTFGLTADQTVKLYEQLAKLAAITALLDQLKATIQVDVVVATRTLQDEELYDPATSSLPDEAARIARSRGVSPRADVADTLESQTDDIVKRIEDIISGGSGSRFGQPRERPSGSTKEPKKPDVSDVELSDEIYEATNREALINEAVRRAKAVQSKIPGETEEAKDDIVAILHGTEHLRNVTGVKAEYLRKAIEELTEVEKKRLDFETKADTIRRIRIGSGSFAAIANVPFNAANNVSVGGPQGPIQVNINGQVMTPAQFETLANRIAAILKKSIANG